MATRSLARLEGEMMLVPAVNVQVGQTVIEGKKEMRILTKEACFDRNKVHLNAMCFDCGYPVEVRKAS